MIDFIPNAERIEDCMIKYSDEHISTVASFVCLEVAKQLRAWNDGNPNGEIMDEVRKIINGERQDQYGKPEDNFQVIADYWTIFLKKAVEDWQVALMMGMMKIARIQTGTATDDSFKDALGYIALGFDMLRKKKDIESK